MAGALAAACAAFGPSAAFADAVAGNDSDALTISITPNVDLGVDIDTATPAGFLDLGSLALGATAFTANPATVSVVGSFNFQELQVQGEVLDTWTLDGDQTANENALQLYALFTTVSRSSSPAQSAFDFTGDATAADANLVTVTARNGGVDSTTGETGDGRFEKQTDASDISPGAGSVDDLSVGDKRHLWFRADLPPTTTVSAAQKFEVTLTAVNGNTN